MNIEGKLLASRYEIIEKIGNGGMATVYKATDKVLKRNVAIKILRDEFTTDEEFIRRFEVEAQSAARLTHANIVSIYDVGVEGNLYYIVMELIQGKTLKEIIIEERGPLPWKWSVNVAIQIASALEMAHRNNIVHRDIKPHNIIITEDGIAKVTDFGIAKAVSNSTITSFGTTIGSVHYFSPEQARGGYTDAKSDIYSLGVVMYEMITGRVPFDADTPVSVALKHMQEDPEEPIELNPNIPTAINKIIMKAIQKDTNLRYQSATEMLTDLRKALKDPDGDFVEELEYDPTARTQVINNEELDAERRKNGKNNKNSKKENKFKAFIKNHKAFCTLIGLILLFALSLGTTLFVLNITNPPEVAMPNVVGLSKEEAQKQIEEAKLTFEIEKEEYNKDVQEGFIISQNPTYMEKFNKVKEKSTVKVIVSKGQEKTKVPNVKGKGKEEAIKAIEDAKLKAEVNEENSKTVKEGYVISQETDPETEVFAGDTVKINVSKGIEKAVVPNVLGKSEEEAKQTLEEEGFVVVTASAEDSSKANGVVLKQSIDSGKSVEKGSSITITINSFRQSKTVKLVIDVKALTGGYTEEQKETNTEKTNNTNETSTNTSISTTTTTPVEKKVNISVSIDGKEVETRQNIDKNKTNLEIPISGIGTQTVTISAGGAKTTKSIDFENSTTVEIP